MTSTDKLVQLARDILVAAGRPLNIKRLFAFGRTAERWPEGVTVDALYQALSAEGPGHGVELVRRGLFRVTPPDDVTQPSKPAPRRRNTERDEADPRERRRRRTRTADLLGGVPAAPVSVEEATAVAREAEKNQSALRQKLWSRLLTRVADVVGAEPVEAEHTSMFDEVGTREPAPIAPEPTPAPEAEVEPTPAPEPVAPVPAPEPEPELEPEPEPEPEVEAPEPPPELQRRVADTPYPGPDRRKVVLPQLASTTEVVRVAAAALESAGTPLTVEDLAESLRAEGLDPQGLSAVLRAENARLGDAGLRPTFVLRHDGRVELVARALSAGYLLLEDKLHQTLAEQRELVSRDLLGRVGALDPEGFERVARLILERAGYTDLDVVVRQGGTLLLTAHRQPSGLCVAVLVRQSWAPTQAGTVHALRSNLASFGAEVAMLVTIGTFSECAQQAAAEPGPSVELIDGAGFADALWRRGVGLATHRPTVRYVDGAFFAALAAER